MNLSIFKGWTDETPVSIEFDALVEMMHTDASLKDLTEKHRYYSGMNDKVSAKRLKKCMPCFGVAVRFEGGKSKDHIVGWTGLTIVDIDDVESTDMARVLALIHQDPHTLLAYTTISGLGIRVITRYSMPLLQKGEGSGESLAINRDSQEAYRDAFLQVNAYYEQLTGLAPDKQCKNVTRLSGVAHDPNLYYNPNAVSFEIERREKQLAGRSRGKLSVERVWPHVERALEQRGIRYEHGTRNKYISQAGYLMNRYGVPEADSVEWALTHFADYVADGNNVAGIIHSCYQNTTEHGKARLPAEKTETFATVADIQDWLIAKNIHIRYNVISRKWEVVNDANIVCQQSTDNGQNNVNVDDDENENCLRTETVDHNNLPDGTVDRRLLTVDRRPLTVDPDNELRLTVDHDNENDDDNSFNVQHSTFTRVNDAFTAPQVLLPSRSDFNRAEHFHRNSASFPAPKAFELTDRFVNSLYRAFSLETGRRLRLSDLHIVIESDFYPEYHPMKDYLESLPDWDGYDYIEELANRVHVARNEQELHNRFFKKWFVGMVAAWFESDKTNHEILTYIGAQGIYKSTFMRMLLPPTLSDYFSARNFSHRMNKDDRIELSEMALIALEELDNMKPHELNQLKAITTDPSVNERAAYARYRERRDHIASFCGTGNNPRFLSDITGNRRWLPFMVDNIDSPYAHPFNYVGLYSQAYTLWIQGFPYWFSHEENAELEAHNRQFEEPSMEEELILTYLRKPYANETGEFLTASRIIELIGQSVRTNLLPRHVAIVMKRLGFEQRRTRIARGWNVVILTGDEIKNNQRQNAHQSCSDD